MDWGELRIFKTVISIKMPIAAYSLNYTQDLILLGRNAAH